MQEKNGKAFCDWVNEVSFSFPQQTFRPKNKVIKIIFNNINEGKIHFAKECASIINSNLIISSLSVVAFS